MLLCQEEPTFDSAPPIFLMDDSSCMCIMVASLHPFFPACFRFARSSLSSRQKVKLQYFYDAPSPMDSSSGGSGGWEVEDKRVGKGAAHLVAIQHGRGRKNATMPSLRALPIPPTTNEKRWPECPLPRAARPLLHHPHRTWHSENWSWCWPSYCCPVQKYDHWTEPLSRPGGCP